VLRPGDAGRANRSTNVHNRGSHGGPPLAGGETRTFCSHHEKLREPAFQWPPREEMRGGRKVALAVKEKPSQKDSRVIPLIRFDESNPDAS
jgi:hypothetical protein